LIEIPKNVHLFKPITLWDTPFPSLNEYTQGGFPAGAFVAIMGPPAEGKTTLEMCLGFRVGSKFKKNVLHINTEKQGTLTAPMWASRLTELYTKQKLPIPEVYLEETVQVHDFFALHGIELDKRLGNVVQLELNSVNPLKSKMYDYINNKNVGIIIYDSLTTPFNTLLIGGRQNQPTRHTGEELFFEITRMLFTGKDLALMTSNHVSRDVTKPFSTVTDSQIKGGKSIYHNHDYILYIEAVKSKYAVGYHRLYVARFPNRPPWQFKLDLMLDENGYREITKEELALIKEKTKEEKSVESNGN